MSSDLARAFVDALHALEDGDGADRLAELYAPGAVSGNTATTRTFEGPDGAREFWAAYRETFESIHSEFRHVVVADDAVALEWISTATPASRGEEIAYEGVTVLEVADGRIARSTAYFDPRVLLAPPAR